MATTDEAVEALRKPQLVHTARQMFETRLAKYNDPHNLEWDIDDMTDKWERHAFSAFMDLQATEAERDQLRAEVERLREYATFCDTRQQNMAEDLGICRNKIASLSAEVSRLSTEVGEVWKQAIAVVRDSANKSQDARLDIAATEIAIRRLETARDAAQKKN